MAYVLQLAQINTGINGIEQSNTSWGFPANTNFSTLLMSYWMCGPLAGPLYTGQAGIWPEFLSANFFSFDPGAAHDITLTNQTLSTASPFFHGTWSLPSPGYRMHFLMSVDTHAQTVQLYVNDQPVAITGTWTGTSPFNFNVTSTINIWAWDVSGVISSGQYPALGDVWISNTPAFVDLTVTANRRKFIDAAWQPVDLGATGAGPFGYQPAMYMSVRPGGVATDILTNLGVGGGTWGYAESPPTFQAPNACLVPALPPGPAIGSCGTPTTTSVTLQWTPDASGSAPTSYNLRYHDGTTTTWTEVDGLTTTSYTVSGLTDAASISWQVNAINSAGSSGWSETFLCGALAQRPPGHHVFLEWSDDRGHSWSNPVGQTIGATGRYRASPQWQRLGMARDRVFRISWSAPVPTALLGAYIIADDRAKT